jgi:hypothetical protein
MTDAAQIVEPPLVAGPIAGAAFTAYASFDLAAQGYLEEEYFLSARRRPTSSTARGAATGAGRYRLARLGRPATRPGSWCAARWTPAGSTAR